jgi:TPR repeat protein
VTRFDRACRMLDGTGCLQAGLMFEEGIEGPADPALAIRFFRRACDENAAAGCTNLGLAFHRGEVVTRDEPRAVRLYEKGCEGGDPGGCANLAYVLHYGLGIEQDPERARALYTAACEVRHPGACENLATLLVSVPGPGLSGRQRQTEPERAARIWREACAAGSPKAGPSSGSAPGSSGPAASFASQAACINYAICLESGLGVPSDPVQARALLRAACEGGHSEGCYQLAVSLEASTAPEAPVERAEALRLYRRVCAALAGAGNRDLRACKDAERLEATLGPRDGLDGL